MSDPSSPEERAERRWWPRVLLLVAAVLVALTFGITTASVESSLGPHEARYDVTTDDTVTIDLGPLGTLQIDSPLPLTLGVRVTVQEIPASVTELDQARTLDALSGDLQSYLQFFSGPQATIQDVARALARRRARRGPRWRSRCWSAGGTWSGSWSVRHAGRSCTTGCGRTCGRSSSGSSSSRSSAPS